MGENAAAAALGIWFSVVSSVSVQAYGCAIGRYKNISVIFHYLEGVEADGNTWFLAIMLVFFRLIIKPTMSKSACWGQVHTLVLLTYSFGNGPKEEPSY